MRRRSIRWRATRFAMSVSRLWPFLAENRYLAEDALDRIEIAYEPLGTVIDPEMAVGEDAPLLHDEAGTNVLAMRAFARGDVGAEMAAAPVRVGARFRVHRKTPVAIENRACLAEYDRGRRSLTLTVSTQIRASFAMFSSISSGCRDTASA